MSSDRQLRGSKSRTKANLDAAAGFASPTPASKRRCVATPSRPASALRTPQRQTQSAGRSPQVIQVRSPVPTLEAYTAPLQLGVEEEEEAEKELLMRQRRIATRLSASKSGSRPTSRAMTAEQAASSARVSVDSRMGQPTAEASTGAQSQPMDIDADDAAEEEAAANFLRKVDPANPPKTVKYVLDPNRASDNEEDDDELAGAMSMTPSHRASARRAATLREALKETSPVPQTRRQSGRLSGAKPARVPALVVQSAMKPGPKQAHETEERDQASPLPSSLVTPSKRRPPASDKGTPTPIRNSKRLDKVVEKTTRALAVTAMPQLKPPAEQVIKLKAEILAKTNGKGQAGCLDMDEAYDSLQAILRETIVRAESNSALVLGPPASGKSMLLKKLLAEFKAEHAFITVHLDGLVHTDDRMALRALSRQLQPESEREKTLAHADMMTSLLAILSHPSEFGESGQAQSVVLVLDHFERFTQHHRQVLLYNLFDIAQSKKAPVCVIGLTAQVDAYDMLEKRVKSRFSHRIIQMTPPATLERFEQLCLLNLTCGDGTQTKDSDSDVDSSSEGGRVLTQYEETWNTYMTTCAELRRLMAFVFFTSKDPRHVYHSLAIPLARQLCPSQPFLDFSQLSLDAKPSVMPHTDGKQGLLVGLSMLERALLVCSCRLEIKNQKNSFATVYDEYATLAHRTSTAQRAEGVSNVRVWSKKLARGAWARLEEKQLVVPMVARQAANAGGSEFGAVRCEVHLLALQVVLKDTALLKHAMQSWLRL